MTVKELIEKLSDFPATSKVVVSGYEGGFNNVQDVKKIAIIPHPNKEKYYYGVYDEARTQEELKLAESAVFLFGINDQATD